MGVALAGKVKVKADDGDDEVSRMPSNRASLNRGLTL